MDTLRFNLSRRTLLALLLGVWLLGSAAPLQAGPMSYMENAVQKALVILQDASLDTPERQVERRGKLREAVYASFDFNAMSQGAVGPKWRKFSDEQKAQFIVLFERLLENTYMNTIERYKSEEVRFTKELIQSATAARVDSVVVSKGTEFKVSYQLLQAGEAWKVVDVIIEGVSVVANYRAQFKQLLRKDDRESIDNLLVTLSNSVNRSEQ
ncbi:MAG: ABC transporter substrate-binding protein [Magnetococcales bacterium]|nr:ABC transporter substrate-binding protein [Magnetococcales bacterium]